MVVIDKLAPLEILTMTTIKKGTLLENITVERLIQMDNGGIK